MNISVGDAAVGLAFEAMIFARQVHARQRRRYTLNPYAEHLAEVAAIAASTLSPEHREHGLAAAWLHDCVEDQGVTQAELKQRFGATVALGVMALSDMEEGTRRERKRLACLRLGSAPGWVQTIKLADLISNSASIVQHDPKFARVYLKEMVLILDAMTQADPRLSGLARSQVEQGISKLAAPGALA